MTTEPEPFFYAFFCLFDEYFYDFYLSVFYSLGYIHYLDFNCISALRSLALGLLDSNTAWLGV